MFIMHVCVNAMCIIMYKYIQMYIMYLYIPMCVCIYTYIYIWTISYELCIQYRTSM